MINTEFYKDKLIIKQKPVGHKFSFKIDNYNNIKFYGKKTRHLSILDRFISDLYEFPIRHIINSDFHSLDIDVLYLATLVENNTIILTGVQKDNIIEDDINYLREISKILNIKYVQPIYEGFLTDHEVEIMTGDYTFDQKMGLFIQGDINFNTVTIHNIESNYSIKLHREYVKSFQRHDTTVFEMTVKKMIEFLTNNANLMSIKISNVKNREIRFIDISLKLFEKYINIHGNDNDIPAWPSFLSNSGHINRKYMTSNISKRFIDTNINNEYLLRIFMLVISGKIKARGLITKNDENTSSMLFMFIKEYINSRGIFDFQTFKKYTF